MMKIKQFICVVIVFNLCEVAIASDVAKAFFDNEVVPDVVNVAPQEEITVKYANYILTIIIIKSSESREY